MARAGSRWALLVVFAVMAIVACIALMMTVSHVKLELKKRHSDTPPPEPDEPTGPFAARIKELTGKEYVVTQLGRDDTQSFGRYVETRDPGLYLDIVSGEALFSSLDKLDSIMGYAEFSKPFDPALLTEQKAVAGDKPRLKVKSKTAGSYLGWIHTDDSGARRYVINSSALRFVPAADFEKNGLGRHRALFPPL